jgi:NAD(P)-dependent dehydrogenase (short-subunit alcohol dehydrogenase family)
MSDNAELIGRKALVTGGTKGIGEAVNLFRQALAVVRKRGPKGVRVVRVSPGWVETEAAVGLVQEIARRNHTDYRPKPPDDFNRRHSDRAPGEAEGSGGPHCISCLAPSRIDHGCGIRRRRRHRSYCLARKVVASYTEERMRE